MISTKIHALTNDPTPQSIPHGKTEPRTILEDGEFDRSRRSSLKPHVVVLSIIYISSQQRPCGACALRSASAGMDASE